MSPFSVAHWKIKSAQAETERQSTSSLSWRKHARRLFGFAALLREGNLSSSGPNSTPNLDHVNSTRPPIQMNPIPMGYHVPTDLIH